MREAILNRLMVDASRSHSSGVFVGRFQTSVLGISDTYFPTYLLTYLGRLLKAGQMFLDSHLIPCAMTRMAAANGVDTRRERQ